MKIKGKILPAILVSFLCSIISFVLVGIIFAILVYLVAFLYKIPEESYLIVATLVVLVVFPFCGAYVGFSLCYFGKLYVKKWNLTLIVAALFGIIPVAFAIIYPHMIGPMECCSRDRAPERAVNELSSKEKLWWMRVKNSGRQFQTNAEIDKEIVTGTAGGGWDTNIGAYYTWTVGPTAAGGTLSMGSGRELKLKRKAATLNSPATWYR